MSPLAPLVLATRYVAHVVAATGCALLGIGMVVLGAVLLALVWRRREDAGDAASGAPPQPASSSSSASATAADAAESGRS